MNVSQRLLSGLSKHSKKSKHSSSKTSASPRVSSNDSFAISSVTLPQQVLFHANENGEHGHANGNFNGNNISQQQQQQEQQQQQQHGNPQQFPQQPQQNYYHRRYPHQKSGQAYPPMQTLPPLPPNQFYPGHPHAYPPNLPPLSNDPYQFPPPTSNPTLERRQHRSFHHNPEDSKDHIMVDDDDDDVSNSIGESTAFPESDPALAFHDSFGNRIWRKRKRRWNWGWFGRGQPGQQQQQRGQQQFDSTRPSPHFSNWNPFSRRNNKNNNNNTAPTNNNTSSSTGGNNNVNNNILDASSRSNASRKRPKKRRRRNRFSLGRRETRQICWLKFITVVIFFLSSLLISLIVFFTTRISQQEHLEQVYEEQANKIVWNIETKLRRLVTSLDDLALQYDGQILQSRRSSGNLDDDDDVVQVDDDDFQVIVDGGDADGDNNAGSSLTTSALRPGDDPSLANYQRRAKTILANNLASWIGMAPMITNTSVWEEYFKLNLDEWFFDETVTEQQQDDVSVSLRVKPATSSRPYFFPLWQNYPIRPSWVNNNLLDPPLGSPLGLSSIAPFLLAAIDPEPQMVITPFFDLDTAETSSSTSTMLSMSSTRLTDSETAAVAAATTTQLNEPRSLILLPILNSSFVLPETNEGNETEVDGSDTTAPALSSTGSSLTLAMVQGVLLASIDWYDFLQTPVILDPSAIGMVIILKNDCQNQIANINDSDPGGNEDINNNNNNTATTTTTTTDKEQTDGFVYQVIASSPSVAASIDAASKSSSAFVVDTDPTLITSEDVPKTRLQPLDRLPASSTLLTEYELDLDITSMILDTNETSSSSSGQQPVLGFNEKYCPYRLHIIPNEQIEELYLTRTPAIYAGSIILVFVFCILVFCLYDILVERRQEIVVRTALKSHDIVAGLFPEVVRNRLFGDGGGESGESSALMDDSDRRRKKRGGGGGGGSTAGSIRLPTTRFGQVRSRVVGDDDGIDSSGNTDNYPHQDNNNRTGDGDNNDESEYIRPRMVNLLNSEIGNGNGNGGALAGTTFHRSRPIADLFPHTTVLFADIAGFTAWSSVRDPTQVFMLLETLYAAIDKLALRRQVFKVETIGDCYVAVTGLPNPQPNHAVIMVRFAKDCLTRMQQLSQSLEVELGPDTGDLKLRIGMHSGPVTAGVLRGQKSRFQLFGDTVNTASRMESNGYPNQIQCSQQTADLLIRANKSHWIHARKDLVHAKGKGLIQTYWVIVARASAAKKSAAALAANETIGVTNNPASPMQSNGNMSNLQQQGYQQQQHQQQQFDDDSDITDDLLDDTQHSITLDNEHHRHRHHSRSSSAGATTQPSTALSSSLVRRTRNDISPHLQRLISWNVDMLSKAIISIVATRRARERQRMGERMHSSLPLPPAAGHFSSVAAAAAAVAAHDNDTGPKKKRASHAPHRNSQNHATDNGSRHSFVTISTTKAITDDTMVGSSAAESEKENTNKSATTLLVTTNPREEYCEAIHLPKFDPFKVVKRLSQDPNIALDDDAMDQLRDFVTTIACAYNDNPFHNFEHASHVTMSANKILKRVVNADHVRVRKASIDHLASKIHDYTYGITSDPLTHFACLFSAMIHDVDHPGVSNNQLLKEDHPLADVYDGKSIAEQNSFDFSWELLMDSEFEELRQCIFDNESELKRFRQLVVNSILATDVFDKELVSIRNERWKKAFPKNEYGDEGLNEDDRYYSGTDNVVHSTGPSTPTGDDAGREAAANNNCNDKNQQEAATHQQQQEQDYQMQLPPSVSRNSSKDGGGGGGGGSSDVRSGHDIRTASIGMDGSINIKGGGFAQRGSSGGSSSNNNIGTSFNSTTTGNNSSLREGSMGPIEASLHEDLGGVGDHNDDGRNGRSPELSQADLKATIVIEHIIQAADVAHTMQHWHVYQKWNRRLFEEMYSAYKSGRSEVDPAETWYEGELWFYDNYIIPLAKKLEECQVFGPSSDEFLTYALDNRSEWETKGRDIVEDLVESCTHQSEEFELMQLSKVGFGL